MQEKNAPSPLKADQIEIYLGRLNISNPYEESITRDVSKIIIHEQWDTTSRSYGYDLAMLILNHQVEFSDTIRPICLTTENEVPRLEGFVAGWGKSEGKEDHEQTPRYLKVNRISNNDCYHDNNNFLYLSERYSTFCAGTNDSNSGE